jgi:ABC-type glycerol-3-phosphate transport system permease component
MNAYRTKRERMMTLAQMVAGSLVVLFFAGPLLWMVSTALKEGNQAFSAIPTLFFRPTLDNLRHVFVQSRFGSALGTSLFTAISSTILALILGSGIAPRWPGVVFPPRSTFLPGSCHCVLSPRLWLSFRCFSCLEPLD